MIAARKRSILVVDDDQDVIDFMTHLLSSLDCDVHTATNGDDALQVADACKPDIVFLDVVMPEQDGWLVCSKLKLQPQAPTIVIITGRQEQHTERFAGFVHADEVLQKPFSHDEVTRVLNETCPIG